MRKLHPATALLLFAFLAMFSSSVSEARTVTDRAKGNVPTRVLPQQREVASSALLRFPGLVPSMSAGQQAGASGSVPLTVAPSMRKTPLLATADGTQIWGLLISSDEWSDLSEQERPYGVYAFNSANLATKSLLGQVGLANGGGSFSNHTLRYTGYAVERSIVAYYYEYDLDTWEVTEQPRTMDGHMISVCSAFDPTTYRTYGVYYGEDFNADVWNFGIIDYDHETTTKLAEITNICVAMICDNEGQLYGITLDGNLNRIDKQTGAFTVIGHTGVAVKGIMQSAVYDRQHGRMYWAAMTAAGNAALYEVSLITGVATKVGDFPNNEEPVALFIPMQYDNGLPAAPANLSLTIRGANTSGALRFDAPSITVDGKKLTENLSYVVKANGQEITSGEAEAGEEEVTAVLRNLSEGYNTFEVAFSNSQGAGKSAYLKQWIGRDVPQAPRNAVFSVDTSNGNLATLSWDAPLVNGVHGGYADPSEFTYKVVRYPGAVTVSEGQKERTFTENIPQGQWATHYYMVYAVNGELTGGAATSNMIAFGEALDLPYVNLIDSRDDFSAFDIFDDGTINTWDLVVSSTGSVCAFCNTWGETAANAWLVAPPVKLRSGYQYEVAFQAFANYREDEKMAIYLGQGTDMEAYKQNVIERPVVYNGQWTNRTTRNVRFDAPNTGDYRVAFNCVSDAQSQYLYIDSLVIKEILCYAAPDSVRQLKVTPSSDGTQAATISFVAPTKRNDGQALDGIDQIEICRDGEVIKTIEHPAVGASLSYTDDEAVNGTTTYSVTAINSADRGLTASATVYVGIDVPVAPTGVRLKDNFDGTATLSWNAVTQGINGMFIPQDGVTYNIYSIVNGSPVAYRSDVTGTSIVIRDLPQTGTQSRIYYGVQSQTEAGAQGYTLSNQLLTGAPYDLPYYESFANSRQQNGPWTVSTKGTGTLGISGSLAQDQDNGSIVCYPRTMGFEGYLCSPKVTLSEAGHPVGSFYYYCTPGANIGIDVQVVRENGDTMQVKQFDFVEETGETGYRLGTFDLSAFIDDHYEQVLFHFYFYETGTSILVDNITLTDMLPNDLAASLSIPVSLQTGDTGKATVTVENMGERPATGYAVKLFQDGTLVDTKDGEELASGASRDYEMTFKASPVSTEAITLQAVVEYAADGNTENNQSASRTVFVYAPEYPAVNDLSAKEGNDGVTLSWSPVVVENKAVTDGFENYYPLETHRIGDWATIDNDGGEPFTFGLNYIKQFRDPFAYVVNNPAAIGYDLTSDPAWGAHEGEQYLVAFGVQPETTELMRNDDWLVTPLLSGEAQTVSLWIKSYNNTFGLEDYQLLVSSTGKAMEDFTVVLEGQAPLEWTQVSVDVPAGTRYVALRHTSSDKAMLMVDDVTYVPGGLTVKGYNVYRNGQSVGTVGADATTFFDAQPDGDSQTYKVTVVYELGESGPSNAVTVATGITQPAVSAVAVSAAKGSVIVDNAGGNLVEVFSADGACQMRSSRAGVLSVRVPAGVYLVKAGGNILKVLVKE